MKFRKDSDVIAKLSPEQLRVTQQNGTEAPGTGEFLNNKEPGIYVDIVSGEPQFASSDKFESGTVWASFTKPIEPAHINERQVDKDQMNYSILYRQQLRRFIISIMAYAFGLGLAAVSNDAQTRKTGDNQKERTMTQTTAERRSAEQSADKTDIRPFRVKIPDEALADLRRRIAATRFPEKETVADTSQGVPLATMQKLTRYWQTDYDWRKAEAKLNSFPQFITTIDGLDIHFIHVRSKNPNALPLIISHGWPGSVLEQIKLIGPLTDPAAHGAKRKIRSTSSSPRCPATVFPASRPKPAGDPNGWRAPGTR